MCRPKEKSAMATNLNIDNELLSEALRLGGKRTKRETVNDALREYVQRRKQQDILALFGKIDFDPHYDYKKARKSRRECLSSRMPARWLLD